MRRILYYSLLCLLWVSVNSCKDDDASTPPPPTLTLVTPTSAKGLLSDDHFIFKVEQVGAGDISLLLYGTDNPSFGGVLLSKSQFTNGVATVDVTYSHVGTFQAVAASTNHSGDGSSVKTSYSSPVTITISSDKASLSDFSFDGSTDTKVTPDDDNEAADHDVVITMPWSKSNDLGKLKLRYSAAAESKVTVGGTAQESDKTENNYKIGAVDAPGSITYGPITYTVTSQDTKASRTYNVYVKQIKPETNANVKSLSAIIANKGKLGREDADYAKAQLKVATGRVLPSYVNNTDNVIVIYDTLNVNPAVYDSLALDWTLDGKFANVKFHENNWGKHHAADRVKGKDTVSLKGTDMPLELEVTPEDSTVTARKVYEIFVAEAPKLHAKVTNITPTKSGDSNGAFAVNIDVISGTAVEALDLDLTFDLPDNTTITNVDIVQDGGSVVSTTDLLDVWTSNSSVNLKKAVTIKATVETDGLPTYVVSYTLSLTVK